MKNKAIESIPEFRKRGNSDVLIVILHSYNNDTNSLKSISTVVEKKYENADIYIPSMPLQWYSFANPLNIVLNILKKIDRLWKKTKYKKIIFIGHSFGALLARKVYVLACGYAGASFELSTGSQKKRGWAKKVDRIILFAGMNRGWLLSHHISFKNYLGWSVGSIIGSLGSIFAKNPPVIFTIRRGAQFITQLRIHWIHMRNNIHNSSVGNALTIQLLGSVDDMVSPDDNIDLVSGREFVYLDMPYSGHENVIEMNESTTLPKKHVKNDILTIGQAREDIFLFALTGDKKELIENSQFPSDVIPKGADNEITDVVFVIHGIRDLGYWTHKVARRICSTYKLNENTNTRKVAIATETSSYGFFPMLPFVFPSKRREKVEWLMDQYTEAKAKYPNAEFSYVGHSNGTYLLARALKDYSACSFKNVVFAGSVVGTRYPWDMVIENGQVKRILNFVSTADNVVATFPKAIQMLKIQDLGSAGHDGFKSAIANNLRYVKGGHSAALNEANWDSIANFILKGEIQDPPESIKAETASLFTRSIGKIAPLIIILAILLLIGLYFLILSFGFTEIGKVVFTVVYLGIIWKIITAL